MGRIANRASAGREGLIFKSDNREKKAPTPRIRLSEQSHWIRPQTAILFVTAAIGSVNAYRTLCTLNARVASKMTGSQEPVSVNRR